MIYCIDARPEAKQRDLHLQSQEHNSAAADQWKPEVDGTAPGLYWGMKLLPWAPAAALGTFLPGRCHWHQLLEMLSFTVPAKSGTGSAHSSIIYCG